MIGSYIPFNDGYGIVAYHYVCGKCGYINEFQSCDEECNKCGFSEEWVMPDEWYEAEIASVCKKRD